MSEFFTKSYCEILGSHGMTGKSEKMTTSIALKINLFNLARINLSHTSRCSTITTIFHCSLSW